MATVDPEAAADLAGKFFDFALDQRVDRFVAPERVLRHLEVALTPKAVERVVQKHLRPAIDREQGRARRRGDQVGDAFTPEATEVLRKRAAQPVHLDRALLKRIINQESVRYMLRSIVQETLDRFVQGLTSVGGSGLLGSLGRSAAGIASSLGSAVLGTVAPQLESQIKRAASSFVAGSLTAILDRLVDNLTSPEGAERLAHLRVTAFDAMLDLPTRRVAEAVRASVDDEVLGLLPGWIAYTMGRDAIREAILDEARAALAVEGSKRLREILDNEEAVAAWREDVVRIGGPLVAEFAGSAAFQAWSGRK